MVLLFDPEGAGVLCPPTNPHQHLYCQIFSETKHPKYSMAKKQRRIGSSKLQPRIHRPPWQGVVNVEEREQDVLGSVGSANSLFSQLCTGDSASAQPTQWEQICWESRFWPWSQVHQTSIWSPSGWKTPTSLSGARPSESLPILVGMSLKKAGGRDVYPMKRHGKIKKTLLWRFRSNA